MIETLLRVDATNVKAWIFKALYTVPAWHTFVISCFNTKSANILKLKINWNEVGQSRPDWQLLDFFKGLVLMENDVVSVTHGFSWSIETIMMSWSLLTN